MCSESPNHYFLARDGTSQGEAHRTLRKTYHWSSTVPLAGKARTALLLKSQAMTGSPKPFIVDEGENPFMSWVDGTQINFNDGGTGQLVHQVSDWGSGVAIKMGRRQGGR